VWCRGEMEAEAAFLRCCEKSHVLKGNKQYDDLRNLTEQHDLNLCEGLRLAIAASQNKPVVELLVSCVKKQCQQIDWEDLISRAARRSDITDILKSARDETPPSQSQLQLGTLSQATLDARQSPSAKRPYPGADAVDPVQTTSRYEGSQVSLAQANRNGGASCSSTVVTILDEAFRHPNDLSRNGFKPYHLTEFKAEHSLNDDVERQVIQYAALVEQQYHPGGCLDSVSVINFGKAGVEGLAQLQGQKFAPRTSHDTMPAKEHFQSGDFNQNPSVTRHKDGTRIIVARYLQEAAKAARSGLDVKTQTMEKVQWQTEQNEEVLRTRAAQTLRVLLLKMQSEIKQVCGIDYTWEVTIERLANGEQKGARKRYDMLLWRADGIVELRPTPEQSGRSTVYYKCSKCGKPKRNHVCEVSSSK